MQSKYKIFRRKSSQAGDAEEITYMLWTQFRKAEAARRQRGFYLRLAALILLMNLLFLVSTFAQLVTVSNVALTNSTLITVNGDVLNTGGTTVANNGTIGLTGDFTNDSGGNLFGTSAGTVVLQGGAQSISGISTTLFNNLTLQGTGTKTLNLDASVGGSNQGGMLTLNAQMLDLNKHELTLTNGTPSAISRSSGFIVSETDALAGYGRVRWLVGNNTGTFAFPFGNSATADFLPVIMEITAPGNGNGSVKAATYPTVTSAAPNNRPLPSGLTTLISNFGAENASNTLDRWWILDVSGYTSAPVSNLTFTYRDSEWNSGGGSTNTIAENALQAQSNDYSTWMPVPAGTVNTFANTVTINGINNYNPLWTLVANSSPLPLTLLAFDAKLNSEDKVDLDWVTATEINNDYFTLEKSADGSKFEPFANVDGAGNSTSVRYYHDVDPNPYDGITYYRLKQTDFDGQFSYSEVRAVSRHKGPAPLFQVFPNPATESFFVKFNSGAGNQVFFLLDMSGKVIREIVTQGEALIGEGIVRVDRLDLQAGMYFVSGTDGNVQKIVIQ